MEVMPGFLLTAWEMVLDRLREVVMGKVWKVMPDLLPTVPFTRCWAGLVMAVLSERKMD